LERREGVVSAAQRKLFKVGDCFVKVPSGEQPVVTDGDHVAVAGYLRHGFITPYACHNITKQIIWHQSYSLHFMAGILVLLCGVFVLTGSSIWLLTLGCIVSLIGILMIAKGIVILRAIRYVSTPQT
jgi:hypothetical protein